MPTVIPLIRVNVRFNNKKPRSSQKKEKEKKTRHGQVRSEMGPQRKRKINLDGSVLLE